MESAPNKVIYIVIGLILALLVATFAFFIFRTVEDTGKEVTDNVTGQITAAIESQWTQYDGASAKGSAIVNLINTTYSGTTPIYITVKTNLDTTGKTYCYSTTLTKLTSSAESTLLTNAKDSSKNEYINPNGTFTGSLQRNANGVITGIIFTQS